MTRRNAEWRKQMEARYQAQQAAKVRPLVAPPSQGFSCFVPGNPKTQGGTVPFRNEATGKTRQVTMGMKGLGAWRQAMTRSFQVYARQQGHTCIDGPWRLKVMFFLPRLAGAPKTIMGDIWPIGRRDADKLERAVNDSLVKAGIVKDDGANVITIRVKRFCGLTDVPGILVQVSPVGMRQPLAEACPEAARAFEPLTFDSTQEAPP